MKNEFTAVRMCDRPDLFDSAFKMNNSLWPDFVVNDSTSGDAQGDVGEFFPDYNLFLLDGNNVVSLISAVPLYYDGSEEDLPDEGWDWALKKSVQDHKDGIKPNTLNLLEILINPEYQGKGVSTIATKTIFDIARNHGLSKNIVCIRPTKKALYPLIPMKEYQDWKSDDGLPFDNWIRFHMKHGGRRIKIAQKSMCISGTVPDWEKWTGQKFPGTGDYVIKDGLVPLHIDKEKNLGTYDEPGIWFVYDL